MLFKFEPLPYRLILMFLCCSTMEAQTLAPQADVHSLPPVMTTMIQCTDNTFFDP